MACRAVSVILDKGEFLGGSFGRNAQGAQSRKKLRYQPFLP